MMNIISCLNRFSINYLVLIINTIFTSTFLQNNNCTCFLFIHIEQAAHVFCIYILQNSIFISFSIVVLIPIKCFNQFLAQIVYHKVALSWSYEGHVTHPPSMFASLGY